MRVRLVRVPPLVRSYPYVLGGLSCFQDYGANHPDDDESWFRVDEILNHTSTNYCEIQHNPEPPGRRAYAILL